MKKTNFLLNMIKGAAIGVAVIIPGVSGGTLAVILNIYDKLISAISNLRINFKQNLKFLLSILLGIAIGIIAMYFPIKYALNYAPLPTVMLFAGFMLGSVPKVVNDASEKGFKKQTDVIALLIPMIFVIGVGFIPGLKDVNLGTDMDKMQYLWIVLIGILGSCALVIPGVSGSLLLLIFGYYQPILGLASGIKETPLHSLAMLALFAVGVVIGFFTIAKLMQMLLTKHPRVTYWAICGFVIGSIPAIFVVFDYANSPINAIQIAVGCALFFIGAVVSFAMTKWAERRKKKMLE